MLWDQAVIIIVSVLTPLLILMGFMCREMRRWRTESRAEIAKSRQRMSKLSKEKGLPVEFRVQSSRSDELYEEFMTLLEKKYPKTHT